MAGIFILIVSLSFIYTLYLQIFSMDSKKAAAFARALLVSSIVGFIGLIVSFIIFYVRVSAIDNADLYGNIRDSYNLFAIPMVVWSAGTLIVTTVAHFIGRKISAIVPSVCHLSSLLVLLWTLIFASLAHFDEISLNVYYNLSGCSLSLAALFPASLKIKKLSALLSDKDYVYSRLHRKDNKIKKSEERKKERQRIKETKIRIKNSTKK